LRIYYLFNSVNLP